MGWEELILCHPVAYSTRAGKNETSSIFKTDEVFEKKWNMKMGGGLLCFSHPTQAQVQIGW
jgi:hypothetical protein